MTGTANPAAPSPESSATQETAAISPDHPARAAVIPDPTPAGDSRVSELRDPALSKLPSDELLRALLERLCSLLHADIAQFLLRETTVDYDVLRIMATIGVDMPHVSALRIPVGKGFAGQIAERAQPALLDDTEVLETFGRSWHSEGVLCLAGVPLLVEGRVIGVAQVGRRRSEPFDVDDLNLLSAAADRAGWAIENGLLLDAERRARHTADAWTEQLHRLNTVGQHLLEDLSVDGVVRAVVDHGLSLLGAIAGGLWEVAGDALILRGVTGYPDEVIERWHEMPLTAQSPAVDAALRGQTVVLRSLADRDDKYPNLVGRASVGTAFVASPLVVSGRTIGVLGLGFGSDERLDDQGLAFLSAAVVQCAAALHRALVLEQRQRELMAAHETSRRLASLQRITARLADARDVGAIGEIIVEDSALLPGMLFCRVMVMEPDNERLRGLSAFGLPEEFLTEHAYISVDHDFPAAEAVRRQELIVLDGRDIRPGRYPATRHLHRPGHALICAPMTLGETRFGALVWYVDGSADAELVGFLSALADQCTHALERARLLDGERAARQRLELLDAAGRIFAEPVDLHLTSQRFCDLVAGHIADGATVHLTDPYDGFSLAAIAQAREELSAAHRQVAAHMPAAMVTTYRRMLDAAQPVLFTDVSPESFIAQADDDETRAMLAELPLQSGIVLPLVASGRGLGLLTLSTYDGSPPLGPESVDHIVELAGRLALALDAARLLRQQTEIAHTLQRSLLPASLPDVPGGEVAVRYLPGEDGGDVGGDFYDVIPLANGCTGLVVGDVMGRGIRAAAVMGQLRAAVRGYALEGHGPVAMLQLLDRLVATLEADLLVTVFYAVWNPATKGACVAVAGHLPPLIRRPGEAPSYLDLEPGLPLGVGNATFDESQLTLPNGSLLLAYTDGLVEGPAMPVDDGMQVLDEANAGALTADEVCDQALAALHGDRDTHDDTALLAFVVGPGESGADTDTCADVMLPVDLQSPAAARGFVRIMLEDWGLLAMSDAAEIVVSELVANAVRHAGTQVLVVISRTELGIRLEVTDYAPGAPMMVRVADDSAESGRGLMLVDQLSAAWGSVADATSKMLWCELHLADVS